MITYKKLIGQGTTDSNGECSVAYNSKGIGDVSINVECRNLQKIFSIRDAVLYQPDTRTTNTDIYLDLPTNYEISFQFTRKSSSNASGVLVGTNGSRNAYIGQYASSGDYGVFFLNPNNPVKLANSSTNTPVNFTLKYDNGTYTMSNGTNTVTLNDFKITEIVSLGGTPNCPLSDILIMPL